MRRAHLRAVTITAACAAAIPSALLAVASPAGAVPVSVPPPSVIAAPVADPAPAPAEPGALIVGLRPGADATAPARRLEHVHHIDVVDAERVSPTTATVEVSAADAAGAIVALRADPAVRYVERDKRAKVAAVTANDHFRSQQWALDRIAVPGAWQRTTGSAEVTVAVIDTGVSAHPDLPVGRIVAGHDFVNDDANAADDHGHGTQVATTIAGAGNDAGGGYHGGAAGVCWSCKIMPIKVLASDGYGWYSDIAAGIRWAADHDADVINLSLGGPSTDALLNEAVAYAVAHDVLVLAAAGNDGVSSRQYPAAIAGVLSVGASTSADARYSWSNYGSSWVDVAAPGCVITGGRFSSWYSFCGTSAATPVVAGVAALALAADPGSTAAELAAAITATADPLASAWTAHGRVNALDVVQTVASAGAPVITPGGVVAQSLVRGSINVTAEATDDDGVASMSLLVNGVVSSTVAGAGPYGFGLSTVGMPRNTALTLVATDNLGTVGVAALPLLVDNVVPALSVSSPVANGYARSTVRVHTSASDLSGVSRVSLYVNGALVSTDTAAPFAPGWYSGRYSGRVLLTVKAWDAAGNVKAHSRYVTVDNAAPAVGFRSAPRSGARVSRTVTVTANAGDRYGIARVDLLVNGRVVARDYTSGYAMRVNTDRFGRKLTVALRAVDRAGNSRITSSRAWRS
ncbi:S8 family serine peptidase [Pilimelia columellifera]|uniref:Peptidase S8/S53 domain-containing protein n=1 Tax=Pilimelia columellifera subsp. columellifera TaxID=706583 RepID=A0ABP6AF26_9ACTN